MADTDQAPKRGGAGRTIAWGVAGASAAAVAGAAFFLWREKRIERPSYTALEADGDYEVRDYPALLVAETLAAGPRERGLDSGFTRLADYIFAKSRSGERLNMTAPVLSIEQGSDWLTRFVMPARFTAETLPDAPAGITIATLPARRVAVLGFSGSVNDGRLIEKEALLRSWIGAKKLTATGDAEHAFYNSPAMPAGMRWAEVLIPIG
jgi:hypothetical protein